MKSVTYPIALLPKLHKTQNSESTMAEAGNISRRFNDRDPVKITQGPYEREDGTYGGVAGPGYSFVTLGPHHSYRKVSVPDHWLRPFAAQQVEMITLPKEELEFLLGELAELSLQIKEIRTRILEGARHHNQNIEFEDREEE
jgi:hypothetical protein